MIAVHIYIYMVAPPVLAYLFVVLRVAITLVSFTGRYGARTLYRTSLEDHCDRGSKILLGSLVARGKNKKKKKREIIEN